MKNYTETIFNDGEYPTSKKLKAFNSRIKSSLELSSEVIAALFQDNTVVDNASDALDKAFYYDASATTYTDWTDEAPFAQTPYFPDVAVSTLDYLYFGFDDTFDGVDFLLGSPASATITPTVQYYDGATWSSVSSLSDNTTGFTIDGKMSWTTASMTDWSKDDLNTILTETGLDSTDRYWIRISSGSGQDYGIHRAVQESPITNELKVKPTDPTSMAVLIQPGYAVVSEKRVSITTETQLSVTAPSANSRYTIVQLDHNGLLSIKNGSSGSAPTSPVVDSDNIKLADILVASTDTTIESSAITDQRIFSNKASMTVAADSTSIVTINSGGEFIFNLMASDSYVVVRDPTDTLQTLYISQDGYGELIPCQSTVVVTDAVYYNTTNTRMEKADADASSMSCEAIVISKPTTTTAVCMDGGVGKVFSSLTPGSDYYLSTTAGSITTTAPSGSGDIIQKIGRALNNTDLRISIDPSPVVLT